MLEYHQFPEKRKTSILKLILIKGNSLEAFILRTMGKGYMVYRYVLAKNLSQK